MNRITGMMKEHYYLLTSLFFFLSFPSYDFILFKGFSFFAWISLIPLFLYLRGKNRKEVFCKSFITGLLANLLAFKWIGAFGAKVPGGDIVVLLFLIPSMTVFFTVKVLLASFLSSRFKKISFLIYPSVWIIFDWTQSIGFLAFPWAYLGYSQYPFTSFIQIASFTGIMGVTFIIVMANYLTSDLIYKIKTEKLSFKEALRFKYSRGVISVFLFVFLATCYGAAVLHVNPPSKRGELRVALVQTCFSPWERWHENKYKYLEILKYYTHLAMDENPDFIVWSEYATLENISYDYRINDMNRFEIEVLNIAKKYNRPLLTGEIGIIDDVINDRFLPQNNAVYINSSGEVEDTYPKIYLVPFGEWFPYGKWLPMIQDLLLRFGSSQFVPGDAPMTFEINNRKFGNLICYEGIFYRLCRKYKLMGADFFVNITNDGWSNTYAGHMQHFSSSVFRAIENGIWYVRAGNTGFTSIIDPYGRIKKSMPIWEKGYIADGLDFSLNHPTIYTLTGDIFLYAAMIFLLSIFIVYFYRKIRYKEDI